MGEYAIARDVTAWTPWVGLGEAAVDATVDSAVSVTVELSADALRRLEAEVARRGISIDDVTAELAPAFPVESEGPRRNPGFVGVGASEHGITDRIDE